MHDAQFMKVFNPANNLLEEFACLLLLQFLLLHDVVEQLAAADVLHDEKELLGCFDNLKQLDDVGMADQFEDVDFACDSLHVGLFRYFPFLKNLHCYLYIQSICLV